MASKNKKKRSLHEVFLAENEMSQRYGLDRRTPKNVYVPDTTQNRVISTHASEEPIDEVGKDHENHGQPRTMSATSGQLAPGAMELGAPDPMDMDMDGFAPATPIDEESMEEECGCGETQGPHIHRVGAPGGPDLGGNGGGAQMAPGDLAPMGGEADPHGAAVIMFDTDVDPYSESAPPEEKEHPGEDPDGEDDYYKRMAGYYDEPHDKHSSDWKPRQEQNVHESFGDVIGDEWLDFG